MTLSQQQLEPALEQNNKNTYKHSALQLLKELKKKRMHEVTLLKSSSLSFDVKKIFKNNKEDKSDDLEDDVESTSSYVRNQLLSYTKAVLRYPFEYLFSDTIKGLRDESDNFMDDTEWFVFEITRQFRGEYKSLNAAKAKEEKNIPHLLSANKDNDPKNQINKNELNSVVITENHFSITDNEEKHPTQTKRPSL